MNKEWGCAKARSNYAKHGMSFSEAEPVLYNQFAIPITDYFSVSEGRFVTAGGRLQALGRHSDLVEPGNCMDSEI